MGLLIFTFIFPFIASASIQIDEDYLKAQIESTPEIQSLMDRLTSTEKLKGSLSRSFLPKFNLTYGRERFTTGPYHSLNQPFGGIEAEVNVFNSGRDALENERRNKEARLALVDATITKAKVLSEGRQALAQHAFLKEIQLILEEALRMNEKNFSGARKRINAGLSTQTDLIDFKQQKVALEQEYETLKYEQGVVSRLLAILLGLHPDEAIHVVSKNIHPEHGPLFESTTDFSNSILLQKAALNSEIARIENKAASRWWAPKLDLYGYALRFTQKEREYSEVGQRNDVTFGFKFTFPLFDGGEGIAQSAASAAQARSREHLLRKQSLMLENETGNATRKLELAHKLIHGAEESVKLMSEYREGIMSEYSKGIKNSPDVLQANQRWIEAKTKFAEVKRDYQIAKKEALYLIGLK